MAEKTARRKPFEGKVPEEAWEHAKAARQEMRESIKSLLPPEFVEHRRQARKEMLLAWRGVLDAAIEHIDEKCQKKA